MTQSPNNREIVVATASDDNYAIGMAVTIRSAMHHLPVDRSLRVYVLDGGIAEDTKTKVLESWQHSRVAVEWIRPDMRALEGLLTIGHLNACTYLRLLMPHVLPRSLKKVIYLDADLLIRRNIAEIWDTPIDDHPVLAAVEVAAPFVDCATVFPASPERYKYTAEPNPVKNYRDLGIPGHRKFFNAGVLCVNLDRWRKDDIPRQAMQCLHDHKDFVLWCDEYALNVVTSGQWGEIDARWNQGAAFNSYPCWQESPFEKPVYESIKDDPWIIHFTWIKKPWLEDCKHPFQEEFLTYLDMTEWYGYRPADYAQPASSIHSFKLLWKHAKQRYRTVRKNLYYSIRDTVWTRRRDAA